MSVVCFCRDVGRSLIARSLRVGGLLGFSVATGGLSRLQARGSCRRSGLEGVDSSCLAICDMYVTGLLADHCGWAFQPDNKPKPESLT